MGTNDKSYEDVVLDAMFEFQDKQFKLDYISERDYLFLSEAFKELENDVSKKINMALLKKEATNKIDEIQAKTVISVKEYTMRYGDSKTSQQNYRGRLHDPLPYHQKVEGGNISYNTEEVEKWLENQHI